MRIEHIQVFGFEASFRGLRNPMDSWDKSDTLFTTEKTFNLCVPEGVIIGPNDLKLACRLIKGGSEHRKFLRQIQIWFDITAPRYVWTELDTYKVATVRNSCSTMHKLGTRDLTQNDFEDPIPQPFMTQLNWYGVKFREAKVLKDTARMNQLRREYKNILPEGFLQKATYMMNYETALTMYFQRKDHKLPEWNWKNPDSICSMIKSLPYMDKFIEAASK